MMSTTKKTEALPIIERVFDVSPERLFKVWTDRKQLAQWWGPKSFTNPICDIDLKPGGEYRITMRSPDGMDFPMRGMYKEIRDSKRIVMTANCDSHPREWHEMVNKERRQNGNIGEMIFDATFEDVGGGKTKLTVKGQFATRLDYDALKKIGMSDGWSQSFDKIEDLVAKS
jgi:uncharacterized protein YndB with AHSA1/START domain